MALVSLREVSVSRGGPLLLERANLQVERGERVCLLGRNGVGKSTLMALIRGDLAPDDGEVARQTGVRVANLAQEVPAGHTGTIFEEVAAGLEGEGDGTPAGHREDWNQRPRVERVLTRMRLDPDAAFEALSTGMKRRVLLARAIVGDPDVLLLDEPTNHLDIDAIRWLEDFLLRFEGTLLFVTHDRVFLQALATRIVEIDRGKLFDWTCDYPTFLVRKEAALAAEAQQQALFDKKLAQEEAWIRQGIKARRTRNEGRVRALERMRRERADRRERTGAARIQATEAERSGALVAEAKGLGFSYDDHPVIRDAHVTIMRGDKVGIVGPNGAGKTTLLRLLLGQLTPQAGTVRLGTRLEVSYFDQLRAVIDEDKTVQENVGDGYENLIINGQPRHIIGYLQDFLFAPERARTPARYLSGGERNRLLLAKLFTKPSNVLVLDEPTNDLDLETMELLEELLLDYAGTILLVSHDRAFLNNVVTSTLTVDPDGRVREYAGGYDDGMRQRESEAPTPAAPKPAAVRPVRDQPRKLSSRDQRELDTLPRRIEDLEAEQAALHRTMAAPEFYRREGADIARTKARLNALERDLAETYRRWEELEAARA